MELFDRYRIPGRPNCRGPCDRRDQVGRGRCTGSQKATSHLPAVGRQATWPADQLQRGADQGRHFAYREWAGKKSLTQRRKDAKNTKNTSEGHGASSLVGLRSKTSLAFAL